MSAPATRGRGSTARRAGARGALTRHGRAYLMEAGGLALFLVFASSLTTALEYRGSALHHAITSATWRRAVLGAGMGAYVTALAYSPWAKRSGAYINPSVTLAFFRLGKIRGWDALFYTAAQFAGGIAAVQVMGLVIGAAYADPAIEHVVTKPGPRGTAAAFAAEFAISLLLMAVMLVVSNSRRFERWAGAFTGVLIAVYLVVETPLSGMSLNPARTFGSAVAARHWDAMCVYFAAPPLVMLPVADVFARARKGAGLPGPTFPRH